MQKIRIWVGLEWGQCTVFLIAGKPGCPRSDSKARLRMVLSDTVLEAIKYQQLNGASSVGNKFTEKFYVQTLALVMKKKV